MEIKMRKSIILVSLILIFQSISITCQILTEEENRNRTEECGWNIDPEVEENEYMPEHIREMLGEGETRRKRVSRGWYVKPLEAPWMVLVNYTQIAPSLATISAWTSGFMISRRHILTDSSVLFPMQHQYKERDMPDTWHWIVNGKPADPSSCLKTGYLEAPKEAIDGMYIRVCRGAVACNIGQIYEVQMAHYIGHCLSQIPSYGMALLTLKEPVENQGENGEFGISPICLPRPDLQLEVNETVTLYGLGPEWYYDFERQMQSGDFAARINRGAVKIKSCYYENGRPMYAEAVMSVCLVTNVCGGDVGGAYVKSFDGRVTAVAIARNGRCNYRRIQPQVQIHGFLKQICKLSGVCDTFPATVNTTVTPKVPETDESADADEDDEKKRDEEEDSEVDDVPRRFVNDSGIYPGIQDHLHSGAEDLRTFLGFLGVLLVIWNA